ncbi:unnamed protein product [Rotaria socialis]|uniref:Uncharacterized protein n=2 Tax=Rotaria socialis TaxID=392032 RepID=A0A818FF10_9BILA|nr:unnamed protein product [Rotaria socialis]
MLRVFTVVHFDRHGKWGNYLFQINKVLNDALKNVSDDDKDDGDDEHEHLTSDNRTLSHVRTADRFLSSPFVYSSFEQNVATAGSFQFSNNENVSIKTQIKEFTLQWAAGAVPDNEYFPTMKHLLVLAEADK